MQSSLLSTLPRQSASAAAHRSLIPAAAAALTSSRCFHDGIVSGGHSPLHNHPLGHVTPASVGGVGMGYHATTILSVRKGGKVVSCSTEVAGWDGSINGRAPCLFTSNKASSQC